MKGQQIGHTPLCYTGLIALQNQIQGARLQKMESKKVKLFFLLDNCFSLEKHEKKTSLYSRDTQPRTILLGTLVVAIQGETAGTARKGGKQQERSKCDGEFRVQHFLSEGSEFDTVIFYRIREFTNGYYFIILMLILQMMR